MGVDRTRRQILTNFEPYRSTIRRTPTIKLRHSHFCYSQHIHSSSNSKGRRCKSWPNCGRMSAKEGYFLSWKCHHNGRGTSPCACSPHKVLTYKVGPFSFSLASSSLSTMAHANPTTELGSRGLQYNKPLLPLYCHGNTGSRDTFSEAVPPLYVLGIPLHKLSQTSQFLVCVFGVLFFYLLYGYTQEWIFSIQGFKPFGWYLTLVQFAFYTLFGTVERRVRMEGRRKVPLKTYAFLAFLTVATMGLSNTSLGYLNYPTQVIFKSCKLIPVMVGGMVIQGKRYTMLDGVALLCMSIGLILFTLADSSVQPNFDQTGVILISMALCADAIIGNVQEKALKEHSSSNVEMVLYSYAVGFLYILAGLLVTGSLIPAFLYCLEHPHMYVMAAIFSLTGYLGINFVLVLVRSFGALLAVTVTTFRKAITMVLSFLLFTKPFTSQYVLSGLLVLVGIALNIYSKNRSKVNNWFHLQLIALTALYSSRRMKYYNSAQFEV